MNLHRCHVLVANASTRRCLSIFITPSPTQWKHPLTAARYLCTKPRKANANATNIVQETNSSIPIPLTGWKAFTSQWNEVLTRQPKAAVATFLAAQSTTLVALHACFVATGVALPPAAAAGWMFARLTRRIRRPVNLFLAAGVYRVVPALGELKVTPLMGIVSDPQTEKLVTKKRAELEESVPWTRPVFSNINRGWKWVQGPMDTYGLALFLASKTSYLATMGAATVAISKGIDLDAILASWGIGEALGEAAGNVAGSAAANVAFVPVHFLAVVNGIPLMEAWAAKKDEEIRLYELETKRYREASNDDAKRQSAEQDEEDKEKSKNATMDMLTAGLLLCSTAIVLYFVRAMGKASTQEKKDDRGIKT